MQDEKEKAGAVLRERERARKGFAVTNDEGDDPLKKAEDRRARRERLKNAAFAVLGLRR
jgi:hypothetical protein